MPTRWERLVSTVGERRVVLTFGALLVAIGAAWGPLEVSRGTPPSTALLLSAFIAGPGVILLYSGYRLPRVDFDPEFYPALVARCLGGFGVMAAIVSIYHFQPADSLGRPYLMLLVLGSFGSVAGYRVGVHNARAEQLQRTRERLDETVGRLKRSNELLDQFAYAASHDLQEPLRMVSSHLLLIERKYGDGLDEEGQEALEFAVDRAERMREMIDGLLEYSRIETAEEPLEPLDLDAVVEDVLADLELQVEESDATIVLEELPRVAGDASQLRQLFQNLLTNAIKYSGDGPPRIHVSAERDGAGWALSVRDEGVGIEPDEVDRIFEVFERLYPHEDEEGTGIGLTLCRRIVERHGGRIWVDSTPGEGSTFSFTLPAAEGATAASKPRERIDA
jgi:signal transduction histidine kinase